MAAGDSDLTPRALRHRRSQRGVEASWSKIQRVIYSPRILQGLPPFAERCARCFWDIGALDAIRAIRAGDVAFFVAFQIRLDQLDCAMVDLGRTIADRAPVTRSKYLLEGFRQAAEAQLIKKGGTWPPALSGAEP